MNLDFEEAIVEGVEGEHSRPHRLGFGG